MSLIRKPVQIKRVPFWCVILYSLSPLAVLVLQNSLISSSCIGFCCHLHLCYGLTNVSSLSSKITTLEVNSPASRSPPPQVGFTQVHAEPWKGNTSSHHQRQVSPQHAFLLPYWSLFCYCHSPLSRPPSCWHQAPLPKELPCSRRARRFSICFWLQPKPTTPLLWTSLLLFINRHSLFTVFLRSGKEFEGVIHASYRQCQKRSLHMHRFNLAFGWYEAKLKTGPATSLLASAMLL